MPVPQPDKDGKEGVKELREVAAEEEREVLSRERAAGPTGKNPITRDSPNMGRNRLP